MQLNSFLRTLLIFIVVLLNAGCDQFSKIVVRERIDYHKPISLVEDNFILVKVENAGAFFGLGENLPPLAKNLGLSLLPILAISMILLYTLFRPGLSKSLTFGLCCIVGGGIGNILDRIVHGSVTDFLFIDLGGIFRTGIFNLADVSIVVGMLVLMMNFKKFGS